MRPLQLPPPPNRSLELAPAYEAAKSAQDRATELATINYTKKRSIAGEIKNFREQKAEAERFEGACSDRVRPLSLSCVELKLRGVLTRCDFGGVGQDDCA